MIGDAVIDGPSVPPGLGLDNVAKGVGIDPVAVVGAVIATVAGHGRAGGCEARWVRVEWRMLQNESMSAAV